MAAYRTQPFETTVAMPIARVPGSAETRYSVYPQQFRPNSVRELFEQADLTADMQAVEQLLLTRAESHSPLITAAGKHTVRAGGKRLRAAMSLLAGRLGTYDLGRVIHAAATAELIHAASLVHDDLVDAATRRRGSETVHTRWDNDVALMVGDYFFALATSELARTHDSRIIVYYAEAVQTIVAGELNPVTNVTPFDKALAQYLYKTGCKTAALFAAACKSGIAAAGGDDEQAAALGRYGYDVGIAFQIVDDVLDFTGNEQTLGKPAGNDLRQGTITLPLIYAVAASDNQLLQTITDETDPSDADVQQVVAETITTGATERALDDARRYAYQATEHLALFPESVARHALEDLAHFVVDRSA